MFWCFTLSRPIIISTQNIGLGPLIDEDLDRLWIWINDKEVTQYLYLFNRMYTREMEKKWLENALRGSENNIIFAILLLPEKLHIGNVGLHNIDLINKHAELGIIIGEKKYWNQGYGAEAVRLALDYGFGVLNLEMIFLRVLQFNKRAIRCYEKVGFRHQGRIRKFVLRGEKWWDLLIMDITKAEFYKIHESIISKICKDSFATG